MSNDDIIKALRLCAQKSDDFEECRSGQDDCPFGESVIDCTNRMNRAAADLIESLQAYPAEPHQLTLDELRQMDGERVFVVLDEDVCLPALVAYNTESCDNEDEDDVVYLTNNLGGRSSFEEMADMGAKIYDRPPGGDARER